jgi:tetratricopeptide (TPR) repeat protein
MTTSDEDLWRVAGGAEPHERATALKTIAERTLEHGEYDRCLAAAEAAATLFADLGEDWHAADSLRLQGMALEGAGRYDAALSANRGAAERFRRSGDERDLGACALRSGFCLRRLGRLTEAAAEFRTAVQLLESYGDPYGVAYALAGLGDSMAAAGDHTGALAVHLRERGAWTDLRDAQRSATAGVSAASALLELDRLPEALDLLERAVYVRSAQVEDRPLAWAQFQYGSALRRAGRIEEARAHLEQASWGFRRVGDLVEASRADVQLALLLVAVGDDRAEHLYRRAMYVFEAAGEDDERERAQLSLVDVLDLGHDVHADARANRNALDRAESAGDVAAAVRARTHLAHNLLAMGDAEGAAVLTASAPPAADGLEVRDGDALRLAHAESLMTLRRFGAVEAIVGELLPGLEATDHLDLRADARELLSDLACGRGRLELALQHRARAVALNLAAGRPERARHLSGWFLEGGSVVAVDEPDEYVQTELALDVDGIVGGLA